MYSDNRFLRGRNIGIMAYGQTGAGKSYTIIGPGDYHERGLVPLTIEHIFKVIESQPEKPLLQVSFVEIYNEDVFDLLDPDNQTEKDLSQWPKMKIAGEEIRGLQKVAVATRKRCLELFLHGNRIRHTTSTLMNNFSSRSHSIFSFYLSDPRDPSKAPAKLCFIDLAGSERNDRSKSIGIAFTEAKNINLSLLTLEKVVLSFERMSEGDKAHFPFRESKLTLLLKELFITDSMLAIICNISPEKLDLDESINTLKFCMRCKDLKIKMITPISPAALKTPRSGVYSAILEATVTKRTMEVETTKLKNEIEKISSQASNVITERDNLRAEVESLRMRVDPKSPVDLSPEAVNKYKQLAKEFLNGTIEQLDLKSIAEAHIYLEFVRQMKDIQTKNYLKQSQEISSKLHSYTAIHSHQGTKSKEQLISFTKEKINLEPKSTSVSPRTKDQSTGVFHKLVPNIAENVFNGPASPQLQKGSNSDQATNNVSTTLKTDVPILSSTTTLGKTVTSPNINATAQGGMAAGQQFRKSLAGSQLGAGQKSEQSHSIIMPAFSGAAGQSLGPANTQTAQTEAQVIDQGQKQQLPQYPIHQQAPPVTQFVSTQPITNHMPMGTSAMASISGPGNGQSYVQGYVQAYPQPYMSGFVSSNTPIIIQSTQPSGTYQATASFVQPQQTPMVAFSGNSTFQPQISVVGQSIPPNMSPQLSPQTIYSPVQQQYYSNQYIPPTPVFQAQNQTSENQYQSQPPPQYNLSQYLNQPGSFQGSVGPQQGQFEQQRPTNEQLYPGQAASRGQQSDTRLANGQPGLNQQTGRPSNSQAAQPQVMEFVQNSGVQQQQTPQRNQPMPSPSTVSVNTNGLTFRNYEATNIKVNEYVPNIFKDSTVALDERSGSKLYDNNSKVFNSMLSNGVYSQPVGLEQPTEGTNRLMTTYSQLDVSQQTTQSAYDALLARRREEAQQNSKVPNTNQLGNARYPRVRSRYIDYFDLDEQAFDNDRTGDDINID